MEVRNLAGTGELLTIVNYCKQQCQILIPHIGNDEEGRHGEYNGSARNSIAQLVRKLATAGLGDIAAEIKIGNIKTAREAVGILTAWQHDLTKTLEAAKQPAKQASAPQSAPSLPPAPLPQPQPPPPPSDGPWSPPDSPAGWAKRFKLSWDTLKRRFEDGSIRYKKLTSKSYRIHRDDMPEN